MAASLRPRRSALYVPGDNARAIEKARTLAADTLIFDLEDAVPPANKETARANVLAALAKGGYGRREIVVRVNGLATHWGKADLAALAKLRLDAIALPKVESAADVREAQSALDAAGAPATLALWAMIETPRGVLRAEEIAGSSARLACLVAGTTDLAKDLHAGDSPGRQALLPSLGMILLAARAYGLACLDGVRLDLSDDDAFDLECEQGAMLGFDGKTLIHPKTIDGANRAFGPTEEELAEARRILAAHEDALAGGKGVTLLDGKLVEQPHLSAAQRVIAMAEQIAVFVEDAGLAP